MTDVHDQEEGWIWLGSRQGADIALGLTAGFDHGIVPGVGTADGLVGFADFEAGAAGGEVEFGGFGFGGLELFGFEDEAAAFIEVDAASGG